MIRRVLQLLIGLFLFGIGISFLLKSNLGASPWDVLAQGIARHIPYTFGTISVLLGIVVLLFWFPLRQKPGIGTVFNALLVGPSADVGLAVLPETGVLWLRVLFIVIGTVLVGLATGLYIGSRFGPGPRDGLMTGLHRVTGQPIWMVRVGLELTVLAIGWLLGGTVGLGTVVFAVFIGHACEFFMKIFYIELPSDSDSEDTAATEADRAPARVLESLA